MLEETPRTVDSRGHEHANVLRSHVLHARESRHPNQVREVVKSDARLRRERDTLGLIGPHAHHVVRVLDAGLPELLDLFRIDALKLAHLVGHAGLPSGVGLEAGFPFASGFGLSNQDVIS